jgi:HK97 family phage major capsid protein
MKHLKEKMAAALAAATQIRDSVQGDWTAEQKASFDGHMAEFDSARDAIEKHEKLAAAETWAGKVQDVIVQGTKDAEKSGDPTLKLWGAFIRDPQNYAKRQAYIDATMKAHSVANPAAGGAAVVPLAIAQEIIRLDDDSTFVRANSPVTLLNTAESLGVVRLDDDGDFNWVSENGAATEGNVTTDRRELKPNRMTKYFDMSRKLALLAPNFDQELLTRLRYIVSRTEENAFLTGSGVGRPQGFMLEANLPTAQVNGSTTADTIAGDDIIETLELLKPQYRNGAALVLSRNAESIIRKLKAATTGEYIWQPANIGAGGGMVGGMPGTILGLPYFLSEFAPSDAVGTANGSLTTGNVFLAIVNLRRGYRIVDAMDIEIDVDMTTRNLQYQTRYVVHKHTDGGIVDDGAFALLKVG